VALLTLPPLPYIRLLVQCHPCPIWPPVLPLNLTYILIFFFTTVTRTPVLYRLVTIHVRDAAFIFISLVRKSIEFIQVRRSLWYFRIYSGLTFFVIFQNLFRSDVLCDISEFIQVRRSLWYFRIYSGPMFFVIFQNLFRSDVLCYISLETYFLRWGVVSPTPSSEAGGPPIVDSPRLLIHYIRNYPPYLESVSSIRNLRTRHAMVTTDPPNIEIITIVLLAANGGALCFIELEPTYMKT
jgi:hypothetical protein